MDQMVDIPLPGLPEWFVDGFLLVFVAVLMIWAAYSYRTAGRRKWLPALGFALMYGVSCGMTALNDSLEELFKDHHRRLKEPAAPVHLEADWGKTFGPENRVRWSQMLARESFYGWGMRRKHFNLEGELVEYVPTFEDLMVRRRRIEYIIETRSTYRMLQIWTIAWLFLPLVCLGVSLILRPRPVQLRAPGDAPLKGGAPRS